MATHGGESLVVGEENPQIRLWIGRVNQDPAVHIGVAPGLIHEHGAQVIQVFLGRRTLLDHSGARDLTPAGGGEEEEEEVRLDVK